jgi:nucleotide-binding universal stress UspA family protein
MATETFSSIVVGYDDTEPAKRALAKAADLAEAFGATLTVTSIAPVLVGRGVGPIDPVDPPSEHREELAQATQYLAGRGIHADSVVGMGNPGSEIAELAEQRGADLIVVGTRELGWLSRLLAPSVSGAVGRKAHCDVLVVH